VRIALPIVVAVVLAVYALVDCLQTEPADVRGPRRAIWLLLIVLVPVLGPVAWLVSRPRQRPRGQAPRPITRPVAPDDNPEFLRSLKPPQDDNDLMRRWEADLRRREEELRRKNEDGDDAAKS